MATTATLGVSSPPRRGSARAALPYLLSLPALIVCIGILVPFGTAVWYSLQRYNLNLPMLRGFVWFEQYLLLFQSAAFWNTVRVSLLYTFLTVGVELLLGLGIALLLRRSSWLNNTLSIALLLPLMVAPPHRSPRNRVIPNNLAPRRSGTPIRPPSHSCMPLAMAIRSKHTCSYQTNFTTAWSNGHYRR